jgi:hypothetical protein
LKPPLAFEDAFEVLGPALPGGEFVLVGGQALNFWLMLYRATEPSLNGIAAVASDDVDFQGSHEQARHLVDALKGSTLELGKFEGGTFVNAIIRFTDGAGVERQIDVLRGIHGPLTPDEVRKAAVRMELRGRDGQLTGNWISVLHPLHCLVSRFHNTHSFDRYQGDRGLLQARAAIGCAKAYLTSLCDENDVRKALAGIKIIDALACSDVGRSIRARYGLDALAAIPLDERLGEKFITEYLPRLRERAGG